MLIKIAFKRDYFRVHELADAPGNVLYAGGY
jgi:hypothetical protein